MKIQKKMNCIMFKGFGGVDKLVYSETNLPKIRDEEVLIKVYANGVNRPDILQRQGKYKAPSNASPLPGLEIAGTIIQIGKKVKKFYKGQKVCALTHGGGYAEYCKVYSKHVLPIPKNISFIEAAAIPETFFTVWTNLFDIGKMKKNDTLLIHGGSSGIGTTAIQLAKYHGCKVIVTVGNKKKEIACRKLGADLVINYKKNNFYIEIMNYTKNLGVNIILDMIGKKYFKDNLSLLRDKGKLLIIAFLTGNISEIDLNLILKNRLVITGSTLRPRTNAEKARIAKIIKKNYWQLLEKKIIKPIIYKTFKLRDVKKAHMLMESSEHIGKIVLYNENLRRNNE